jgi:hypothetical protein
MPCSYVIDKERRLVFTTVSDVLTAKEALENQNRLISDISFNPDFGELIDAVRVTGFEIDSRDIELLAARNIFSPSARRALVTTHGAAVGMLRLFQAYRELSGVGEHIRVFSDVSSAERWLFDSLDTCQIGVSADLPKSRV